MLPREFSLEGKVAVVTGGHRGWYKDIALVLADAGADVVIAAKAQEDINSTAGRIRRMGRKSSAVTADVTKAAQAQSIVDRVLDQFGRIDILVNAADVLFARPVSETSDEEWHYVLNMNLTAAFLCCRVVSRVMKAQKSGRIINIASGLAERGVANFSAYSASKGGLVALTRALSIELGRDNIKVVAVAPGWLSEEAGIEGETAEDPLARYIPVKRKGTFKDLGDLVVFLASDASDYVSGHVFFVDGGLQIHP